MKAIYGISTFRRMLLLLAALGLAACGQQTEPEGDTPDAGAMASAEGKIAITTESDEARALYMEAQALSDNLHFTEAHNVAARAVAADPTFARGYWLLAVTSQTAAQFFDAVEKASANAAGASEGEQLMIAALQANADNDQAAQFKALNKLSVVHPEDERVHMLLGGYYNGQQDYDNAIAHYEKATKLNPKHAAAVNALGYARRSNEDFDGAREAFEKYIEIIPDEANPYDSYAELLMEIGEYDASIENYRKALAISPTFPASFVGISINQSLKGDVAAAEKTVGEMLDASRNNAERLAAMAQAVTVQLYAGNSDRAKEACEDFLSEAATVGNHAAVAGMHDYMGDMMVVAGDAVAGQDHYDQALSHQRLAATNAATKAQAERAHMFKSAMAAMVGEDMETMLKHAEKYFAAADAEGTSFEKRRVHELKGYIAMMNEDAATAVAELEQANQLEPMVVYWSAVANRDAGNLDKARELAKRAAHRNTLSANLPFFRSDAMKLLEELAEG